MEREKGADLLMEYAIVKRKGIETTSGDREIESVYRPGKEEGSLYYM